PLGRFESAPEDPDVLTVEEHPGVFPQQFFLRLQDRVHIGHAHRLRIRIPPLEVSPNRRSTPRATGPARPPAGPVPPRPAPPPPPRVSTPRSRPPTRIRPRRADAPRPRCSRDRAGRSSGYRARSC